MGQVSKRSITLWIFLALCVLGVSFTASSYLTVREVLNVASFDDEFFSGSGNIVVLEVNGVIMDSKEVLRKIEEIKERSETKGVLVRIDSPGGAVGPSQEIYEAVKSLREKFVVICSFGNLAASGGYYIAAACQHIVSNAGTLTGSIGVIMSLYNLKELYAWAKVEPNVMKAGRFKDAGSDTRPMTEAERKLFQDLLDSTHKDFKDAVRDGRKLDQKVVDEYADGRILTGRQALELGFVDRLGGEEAAIAWLAELCNLGKDPKVVRERTRNRFRSFTDIIADVALEKMGMNSIQNQVGSSIESHVQRMALQHGVPYYLPASFSHTLGVSR